LKRNKKLANIYLKSV